MTTTTNTIPNLPADKVPTGRHIGALALIKMIEDADNMETGAYTHLKHALGCKGDRKRILTIARAVLRNIANW